MTHDDYILLVRKVEEAFNANLNALKEMWVTANKTAPPLLPEQKTQAYVNLAQAIREELSMIMGHFSVHDVEILLGVTYPRFYPSRASISNVLNRMTKEGYLKLIRQGKGRAFSVYAHNEEGGRTAVHTTQN